MNVYQKIAVGGFVMLVVAVSVTTLYNQQALLLLTVFALIVALLTFPAVWQLIFLSIQAVGILIGGIGHAVASIGDAVVDWTEERRRSLAAPSSPRVPDWGSPQLQGTTEQSEELDIPPFMESVMEGQNN